MAQSADGYLWIVSSDGLIRFDGVSFERMPALNDPKLGEYQAFSVHASPNGDVWIGYRPGAVALYRKGHLYNLNMPNPPEFLTFIEDDGRGGLWVVSGRGDAALSHYHSGKWEVMGDAQGVHGQVGRVFIDRSGITWVVEQSHILFLKPGARRFTMTPAQMTYPAQISQGLDGRRWLSDRSGLRPLPDYPNGATDPAIPAKGYEDVAFRTSWFDPTGNLWGTDAAKGLFQIPVDKLDDAEARFHPLRFTAADGLTSNRTLTSLMDREGNIWVGTDAGLDRLREAVVRPQPGLNPISINWGGVSDVQGNVYIVDDDGIHVIGRNGILTTISNLIGETTSAPCRRRDGSVVVLTSNAVWQLRPSGVKILGTAPEAAFACTDDARGRLWMWGPQKHLQWWDRLGWHEQPTSNEKLTPAGLATTPSGVALLRVGATDLMKLGRATTPLIKASSIGVGAIWTVNEGKQDLLISGNLGLAGVRNGVIRQIKGDRFPWLTKLRSIAQTSGGDTWMQSPAGIVRVRTGDLERAFEDPTAPLPHDLFDAADGLVSKGQKNGLWGDQIFEGADGIVRFLTGAGVVTINPRLIMRNTLAPPVVVSSLTSGGEKYLDPTTVNLAAGRTNIRIAYSALSLSVPGRVRFRYKLDGFDENWVDPGRRREAVYANLAPGSYRFNVIAANNDGVWNRQGATLLITVAPTFFQTIWFKVLCVMLIVAVLWWAYQVRVRQLVNRMNTAMGIRLTERERIARELHDTLLQSFQGLMLQLQAVANRLPPGQSERHSLEQALQSADGALVEGRNRVNELRTDTVDRDFSKRLVALADELGSTQDVHFKLTVEGRPRAVTPLVEDELQRIGEEALRNAYQHSKATKIEGKVGYRGEILTLEIRDDGVGLPAEVSSLGSRSGHYGLLGMRERARRIGGVISIVSEDGKGSVVLVSVPAKTAYVVSHRLKTIWPFNYNYEKPDCGPKRGAKSDKECRP
ncbi:sensor histidine kinase [Sphingomonas sp. UYP23]